MGLATMRWKAGASGFMSYTHRGKAQRQGRLISTEHGGSRLFDEHTHTGGLAQMNTLLLFMFMCLALDRTMNIFMFMCQVVP